jgi:hypothetical protein
MIDTKCFDPCCEYFEERTKFSLRERLTWLAATTELDKNNELTLTRDERKKRKGKQSVKTLRKNADS